MTTAPESKCDTCGGYGYREKVIFGKWRVVPCFRCQGNGQFVSRATPQRAEDRKPPNKCNPPGIILN